MTKSTPGEAWNEPPWMHGALRNGQDLNADYPLLPYGEHATRTLVAKATFSKRGVTSVSFLPAVIDQQYRPQLLTHDDSRFADALRYMEWTSEGLPHTFTQCKNEIQVTP